MHKIDLISKGLTNNIPLHITEDTDCYNDVYYDRFYIKCISKTKKRIKGSRKYKNLYIKIF